jgi:TM2 domain-containing membrane protein YozV
VTGAPRPGGAGAKSRTTAGILAILVGAFGVHKFYLGRTSPAVLLLVVSLVSLCCGPLLIVPWLGILATSVIGIVEGAIILGKSDEEFQQIYVDGCRDWF